jgi:DNA repair protein RadC
MEEKKVTFSIKNWKEDDRPREKLLTKGKDVLSDAELIAIILGSGSRKESALDLAKRILSSVENNLSNLAKLSIPQLMAFNGVGEAKSVSVVTALEIGRRRRLEEALTQSKITSSKSVFDIMQPILGELQHEEFWIVYLNNSNKVLLKFQMSKGGISGTLVDTRLVFKKAVEIGATSIILVHNHPSGTLVPSNADKMLTQKILKAGQTLDIKVLDHIIITEKSYFSFADSNEL